MMENRGYGFGTREVKVQVNRLGVDSPKLKRVDIKKILKDKKLKRILIDKVVKTSKFFK